MNYENLNPNLLRSLSLQQLMDLRNRNQGTPMAETIQGVIEEKRPSSTLGQTIRSLLPNLRRADPLEARFAAAYGDRESARPGPGMSLPASPATPVEAVPAAQEPPPAPPEANGTSGAAGQPPRATFTPATITAPKIPASDMSAFTGELPKPDNSGMFPENKPTEVPKVDKADLSELEKQTKVNPWVAILRTGLGTLAAGPGKSALQSLGEGGQQGLENYINQRKTAAEASKEIAATRRAERGEERENAKITQADRDATMRRAQAIIEANRGDNQTEIALRNLGVQAATLAQQGDIARATNLLRQAEIEQTGRISGAQIAQTAAASPGPEQLMRRYQEIRNTEGQEAADQFYQFAMRGGFGVQASATERRIATLVSQRNALEGRLKDYAGMFTPEAKAQAARLQQEIGELDKILNPLLQNAPGVPGSRAAAPAAPLADPLGIR